MAEAIDWVREPEAIAVLQSAARQRLLDRLEAIGLAPATSTTAMPNWREEHAFRARRDAMLSGR